MSCLNLRLPPATKAWRNLTSKFLSRLRKLSESNNKAIKKPKNRLYVTNTTAEAPIMSIIKPNRKKRVLQSSSNKGALRFRQRRSRYLFKKKAGPVYIDKLFKQPIAVAELVAQQYPPPSANNVKEEKACASAADDMWESLALASPQMKGIDQRAEEFIRSFRADMELQEMMARRL